MMTEEQANLQQRIEWAVNEFLQAKTLPPDEARARSNLISKQLEDLFWDNCAKTLDHALDPKDLKLKLNDAEFLSINTGLLNLRLLEGNPQEVAVRIVQELKTTGEANHYYLTELLEERLRNFVLYDNIAADPSAELDLQEVSGDVEGLKIIKARSYDKLRPLFEDLPGFSKQVLAIIHTGKLDTQIEEAIAQYRIAKLDELRDRVRQLHSIRVKVFEKVRARCTTQREVDNLEGLRTNIELIALRLMGGKEAWAELSAETRVKPQMEQKVSTEEQKAFITTEVKLVRSLIQIGALSGGIMNARSVLYSNRRRITKADTARVMAHIKEVDPRLPGNPNLLIAPYEGNGFFEWDRDSLIVALQPNRSIEETIVNAAANFRLLVDRMHQNNALKDEYDKTVEQTNFRNAFLKAYREWVLGIGAGNRAALTPAQYQFFKKHIGPDVSGIPMPFKYRNLAATETKALVKKLRNEVENNPEGARMFDLALLLWMQENTDDAQEYFERALADNSSNPGLCFCMGLFYLNTGERLKAENFLSAAIACGSNSIWKLYAEDELEPLHQKFKRLV